MTTRTDPGAMLRAVAALTVLACSAAGLPAFANEWQLAGRHGECAPLASLKRKLADLPDVRTPDAFATYLDAKRLAYRRLVHALPSGQAIEFQVPDAGLSVLLVPASVCRSLASPPR